MRPVNWKRVILGGIVAAVIVNLLEGLFGYLMRREWEAALQRLGVVQPGAAIALPIAWSFVVGVLSVWLYAAIRSRYGPGPVTAIRAALAIWAFSTVGFGIAMACLGLFPVRMVIYMTLWSLAEIVVALLAGAALYREPGGAEIDAKIASTVN